MLNIDHITKLHLLLKYCEKSVKTLRATDFCLFLKVVIDAKKMSMTFLFFAIILSIAPQNNPQTLGIITPQP